ncbi:hypothetical protein BIFDEN_01349 [Bifidobacterium dentium ATCC 27678]|nr:hypothetical protein BIFDEN_01349 [Bifidobacterium dentium ATCC 27678]
MRLRMVTPRRVIGSNSRTEPFFLPFFLVFSPSPMIPPLSLAQHHRSDYDDCQSPAGNPPGITCILSRTPAGWGWRSWTVHFHQAISHQAISAW